VAWHLDTNVCIDLLRGKSKGGKLPPFAQCQLSAVVAAELWTGEGKSADPAAARMKLATFLGLFSIVSFDATAGEAYGEIRAQLEKAGTPIGPMDLMIAAHARSAGATLLTSNLKEFRRVPGLNSQAWG
jgi:tRNA(fMet)-specific endonuclease VapC